MKSSMESAEPAAPPVAEVGNEIMSDVDEAETEEEMPPEDEELISVAPPGAEEELMSDANPAAEETMVSPDDVLADEDEYYPPASSITSCSTPSWPSTSRAH